MGERMYRSKISWPQANWRWMVSFTALPLYPRSKNPRYILGERLGRPQNRSGRCGGEKILDPIGTLTQTPRSSISVASRYTDWAIPAHTLEYQYLLFKWQSNSSLKIIKKFHPSTSRHVSAGMGHHEVTCFAQTLALYKIYKLFIYSHWCFMLFTWCTLDSYLSRSILFTFYLILIFKIL
jgi:hypothetical protein